MSWKDVSVMSQRAEFVQLASVEGSNVSELCRRFGVSRKTGYKWLSRFQAEGNAGLMDQSRRPLNPGGQTSEEVEQRVLSLRSEHPAWGGRKLRVRLMALGHADVPAASTITEILRRHGRLDEQARAGQSNVQRFEHPYPNDLWQMDFKGHFPLTRGGRCHPLTVLDDHSRYSIGLRACDNERTETVQRELIAMFRCYGLPRRMLMDHGSPWGDAGDQPWTHLTAWLVRLGISISHGRPRHPQTQGKDERFHRTLRAEVLRDRSFLDVIQAQRAFDPWRQVYNTERPHEALSLEVPATRYRVSPRPFPEQLLPIEYAPDVKIRHASTKGVIKFEARAIRVSQAFAGEPIGIRATPIAGRYEILYAHQVLGHVDLSQIARGSPEVLNICRTSSVNDHS
jgi:transposase InsO family protein